MGMCNSVVVSLHLIKIAIAFNFTIKLYVRIFDWFVIIWLNSTLINKCLMWLIKNYIYDEKGHKFIIWWKIQKAENTVLLILIFNIVFISLLDQPICYIT